MICNCSILMNLQIRMLINDNTNYLFRFMRLEQSVCLIPYLLRIFEEEFGYILFDPNSVEEQVIYR